MSELVKQLRSEVSQDIQSQTNKLLKELSTDNIREMIRNELQLYDADKTGKPDYALEVSGLELNLNG